MLRAILTIITVIYGLLWFLIFMNPGTYSSSNKEAIDSSVQYYHSIRDDLEEMALFVNDYQKKNGEFPNEEIFDNWNDEREDFHYKIGRYSTDIYYNSAPDYIIERYGQPTNNSFSITIWDGGEHLFYASWVNGNSADVSTDDFGIPRNVSGVHFILSLSVLVLLRYKSLTSQLISRLRRRTH